MSDLFSDLPAKPNEPRSTNILNGWLSQLAGSAGVPSNRLGWIAASTIVIALLQRAKGEDGGPLFLVKGGT